MNENAKYTLKAIMVPVGAFLALFAVTMILSMSHPEYTGHLIPLTIGIVFRLVASTIEKLAVRKKEQCTYLTSGKIVGYEISTSDDSTAEYPVYQYSYGGEEYTVRSNVSDSRKRFSYNQEVNIFLDPEDPTNSYIEAFDDTLVLVTKIFRIVGFILIIIAAATASVVLFL